LKGAAFRPPVRNKINAASAAEGLRFDPSALNLRSCDYWTTNVMGVVCENVPEVAETVMVYVPGGVPVVVVVEL